MLRILRRFAAMQSNETNPSGSPRIFCGRRGLFVSPLNSMRNRVSSDASNSGASLMRSRRRTAMARVKRGTKRRARRKKLLKHAKGFFLTKGKLYHSAKEAVNRSLRYTYRDRRNRKREYRSLWIQRIGAAARNNGLTYSQLIHGLKLAASIWTARCWRTWRCRTPRDLPRLSRRRSSICRPRPLPQRAKAARRPEEYCGCRRLAAG